MRCPLLTDQSIIGIVPNMIRPREFDRDEALGSAIQAFAEHGYEGTSTEALLEAMCLSRQSLYNTFGDKRHLYLEALRQYNTASIAEQIETLNRQPSPLKGLESMLTSFIARGERSCLGLFAIMEFGQSDPDVRSLGESAGAELHAALKRRIAEGKVAGEIEAEVEPGVAARFIVATLAGLKLAARAGSSAEELRKIARMALRSLTAHT
jgi:TetR/AcrR family transcriptional regulator, transcriptional repressor for nem operon